MKSTPTTVLTILSTTLTKTITTTIATALATLLTITLCVSALLLSTTQASSQASQTQANKAPASTWLLVTSNPPDPFLPSDPPLGRIFRVPTDLSSAAVAFSTEGGPVGLESLTLDPQGNAFVTFFDGPDEHHPGGVIRLDALMPGRDGERFDAQRDDVITGSTVALVEPKGLGILEGLDIVLVADNHADQPSLTALPLNATGDTTPLFRVTDFGPAGAQPWWFDYDPASRRLFVAATDGTLLVYDEFPVVRGASGPDRIVTPTAPDGSGRRVSANLHGIIYVAERDKVILSDVGPTTTADQPDFDRNGALLVLENASHAEGPSAVRLHVHGPASTLGNPVYIDFDGTNVYVAEKTKDTVLRFDTILEQHGTLDLAPDAAVSVPAPESIVLVTESLTTH